MADDKLIKKKPFNFFDSRIILFLGSAAASTKVPVTITFESLSSKLKTKFKTAGIRNGEISRSSEDASKLFLQLPRNSRTRIDDIAKVLTDKDASHITSHGKEVVKGEFNPLNSADNILWESAKTNRKRGNRQMTNTEIVSAKNALNAESARILLRNSCSAGFKTGLITACLDLPLNCMDEMIERNQRKISLSKISLKTAKTLLMSGLTGCGIYLALSSLVPEDYMTQCETIFNGLSVIAAVSYVFEFGKRVQKVLKIKQVDDDSVLLVIVL
jgi:hypothetical protein